MNLEPFAKAADYFENLDPALIDQKVPFFADNCPSCVGAHLWYLFPAPSGGDLFSGIFLRGFGRLAGAAEINFDRLWDLLFTNGATRPAFSAQPWPTPPAVVFRRIADSGQI